MKVKVKVKAYSIPCLAVIAVGAVRANFCISLAQKPASIGESGFIISLKRVVA